MDDRDSHKRRVKYLKRIFVTSFIMTIVLVCGLEKHIIESNEKHGGRLPQTIE